MLTCSARTAFLPILDLAARYGQPVPGEGILIPLPVTQGENAELVAGRQPADSPCSGPGSQATRRGDLERNPEQLEDPLSLLTQGLGLFKSALFEVEVTDL